MLVAILGIIAFLIGTVLKRSAQPASRFGGILSIAGVVLVVASAIFSTFVIIEPGQVGVQTLFGKVKDKTLESGLHVINPMVNIVPFSIQTENYTMSAKTT